MHGHHITIHIMQLKLLQALLIHRTTISIQHAANLVWIAKTLTNVGLNFNNMLPLLRGMTLLLLQLRLTLLLLLLLHLRLRGGLLERVAALTPATPARVNPRLPSLLHGCCCCC